MQWDLFAVFLPASSPTRWSATARKKAGCGHPLRMGASALAMVVLSCPSRAASAVTDVAIADVDLARVVISTGVPPGKYQFMYSPVIETLRAGFLHATPHVGLRSSVGSAPWEAEHLKRGDVYVHVGPLGHELVPWHELKRRGVVTVYYQTEPVKACYGNLPNALPEPQVKCEVNSCKPHTSPPQHDPAADVPGDTNTGSLPA